MNQMPYIPTALSHFTPAWLVYLSTHGVSGAMSAGVFLALGLPLFNLPVRAPELMMLPIVAFGVLAIVFLAALAVSYFIYGWCVRELVIKPCYIRQQLPAPNLTALSFLRPWAWHTGLSLLGAGLLFALGLGLLWTFSVGLSLSLHALAALAVVLMGLGGLVFLVGSLFLFRATLQSCDLSVPRHDA